MWGYIPPHHVTSFHSLIPDTDTHINTQTCRRLHRINIKKPGAGVRAWFNKQASKSLPGVSPSTSMKTTQQTIRVTIQVSSTVSTRLRVCNVITVSLVFTSVCRQKKCYITCDVKFATIHWNFMNAMSFIICQ